MLKFITLLLAINFLIACDIKIKRVKEPMKDMTDPDNDPIRGVSGQLSAGELEVAKVACLALYNKITKFKTILLGTDFVFDITENSCPPEINTRGTAALRLELEEGILKFNLVSNYDGSYLREVYTSQSGDLQYFCPGILNGPEAKNSYELSYNRKVVLQVKGSILEPELSLSYLTKRTDTNYSLERKVNLKVDVSPTDYEGNILNFEIQTLCVDQINYSKINQVFIP